MGRVVAATRASRLSCRRRCDVLTLRLRHVHATRFCCSLLPLSLVFADTFLPRSPLVPRIFLLHLQLCKQHLPNANECNAVVRVTGVSSEPAELKLPEEGEGERGKGEVGRRLGLFWFLGVSGEGLLSC